MNTVVDCAQCGIDLGDHSSSSQISIEVMGDEHMYAYWFCKECDVYTELLFIDEFLGSEYTLGPSLVDRKRGDERVDLIGNCPDRTDRKCRCESHRKCARTVLDGLHHRWFRAA